MATFTPIGDVERALFVTADEAAAMGQKPLSFFAKLIQDGRVPVLWGSLSADTPPVPLLSMSLVREAAMRDDTVEEVEASILMRTRFWILEYVKSVPPVWEYDVALSRGAPFVARAVSRHGAQHAHVQVRFLLTYLRMADAPLTDRLESRLKPALRLLGARVIDSGLRDERGKLRSRSWWRLPLAMWQPPQVGRPVPVVAPVPDDGWEDDVSGVEPVEESE